MDLMFFEEKVFDTKNKQQTSHAKVYMYTVTSCSMPSKSYVSEDEDVPVVVA